MTAAPAIKREDYSSPIETISPKIESKPIVKIEPLSGHTIGTTVIKSDNKNNSTKIDNVKTESKLNQKPEPVTIIRPDISMLAIVRCPHCPGETIEEDFRAGHLVCTSCGLIIGSQTISAQSEWRNFNDDDGTGGEDRNRVGGVEGGLLDHGLGTVIGASEDGAFSSLAKYQNAVNLMARNGNHTLTSTSKLIDAFKIIDRLSAKLGLPATISHRAKELYSEVEATKAIVRRREVVACAILYIACKLEGQSRTLKEIAEVSDARFRAISSTYSAIKKLSLYRGIRQAMAEHQARLTDQTLGSQSGEAINLLERYCSQLELPYSVVKAATHVVRCADQLNIAQGRQPATVAGASIYFACMCSSQEKHRQINLTLLSFNTKQAKSTVQALYQEYYKRRTELAPPNWTTAQQIEQMAPQ